MSVFHTATYIQRYIHPTFARAPTVKRRKRKPPVEWRLNLAHLHQLPGEAIPRASKEAISLRVDADVLVWFRRQGRGYQTRMNAILRDHMRHSMQRL
jgi:uncharacterized protein (DUF4415 family)